MCKRLFTTTYYLQLPTKSTTYNYLGTVTLHNLFTLYTFDNIGAGLWKVRIGKAGYLNVPYDILPLLVEWRHNILYGEKMKALEWSRHYQSIFKMLKGSLLHNR